MTLDQMAPILFSGIALGGALILLARRIARNGLHNPARRRYLLIDIMIVIAVLEILIDAIADQMIPPQDTLRFLAIIGRGAVTVGVVALLITFPAQEAGSLGRRHTD